MSTTISSPERLVAQRERPRAPSSAIRRLVVATKGASTSQGALAAARAISVRHETHVSVVSVFQPRIPYPQQQGSGHRAIPRSDRDPAQRQLAAVREQVATLGTDTAQWSLAFMAGQPAHNIVTLAHATHADLVVIGMGREDSADRGAGDRASMAIAASVQCPLLAVSQRWSGTPRSILVAVGNDDSAAGTLFMAQSLFAAPERLFFVHVAEVPAPVKELLIPRQFDMLRDSLTAWGPTEVEMRILRGDPIDQMLAFAREHSVDLIAGGLHGHSVAERSCIRNAVVWVMALGNCSVLLVPTGGPSPY